MNIVLLDFKQGCQHYMDATAYKFIRSSTVIKNKIFKKSKVTIIYIRKGCLALRKGIMLTHNYYS